MPRPFPSLVSVLLLPLHIAVIFFPPQSHSQYDSYNNKLILLRCPGDNYSSPSPYKSILLSLLANLTASVPNTPSLHLTKSAAPHIFALAQCRFDASRQACYDCLNKSTAMLTTATSGEGCGHTFSAAAVFDLCLLHYTNQSFDFPDSTNPSIASDSPNASSPTQFKVRVNDLLSQVSRDAAKSDYKFAVGKTYGESEEQSIYGMAWCARDLLTTYDCEPCLRIAMNGLNFYSVGGRAATVSCVMRFEIYEFFNPSLLPQGSSQGPIHDNEQKPFTSTSDHGEDGKTKVLLVIAASEGVALVCLSTIVVLLLLRMKKMYMKVPIKESANNEHRRSDGRLFLDLCSIIAATNNFSEENKLGNGGFGAVYRGALRDGEEIAVKRLSKTSSQGIQELENEVAFVAKLQHRNLVLLLGCCLEKEEKLLVYEFLPNKSLDKFLFDPVRRAQLDWGTRFKIIEGVAQGLIYLHEDSRLRVIHCDLKASNILLDSSMNPKISDFGFAKLFGINEAERKTSRIGGTCGYMAPEYAMHGFFSTKSDVYSYGVLVLEIVTGRRNSCLNESLDCFDLLSYVWSNWKNGQPLQALDQSLGNRYIPEQALRCIQIGLMCIQEDPALRPSMVSLVIMLHTCTVTLPEPLMPAFLSIADHFSSIE